jgi:hypothetical protein
MQDSNDDMDLDEPDDVMDADPPSANHAEFLGPAAHALQQQRSSALEADLATAADRAARTMTLGAAAGCEAAPAAAPPQQPQVPLHVMEQLQQLLPNADAEDTAGLAAYLQELWQVSFAAD